MNIFNIIILEEFLFLFSEIQSHASRDIGHVRNVIKAHSIMLNLT